MSGKVTANDGVIGGYTITSKDFSSAMSADVSVFLTTSGSVSASAGGGWFGAGGSGQYASDVQSSGLVIIGDTTEETSAPNRLNVSNTQFWLVDGQGDIFYSLGEPMTGGNGIGEGGIQYSSAGLPGQRFRITGRDFYLGAPGSYISSSAGSMKFFSTGSVTISGSEVNIETPAFFMGATGSAYISGSTSKMEISSSNFQITSNGRVKARRLNLVEYATADYFNFSAPTIQCDNATEVGKYFVRYQYGGKNYYALILNGSRGGNIGQFCRLNDGADLAYPIGMIIPPGHGDGDVVYIEGGDASNYIRYAKDAGISSSDLESAATNASLNTNVLSLQFGTEASGARTRTFSAGRYDFGADSDETTGGASNDVAGDSFFSSDVTISDPGIVTGHTGGTYTNLGRQGTGDRYQWGNSMFSFKLFSATAYNWAPNFNYGIAAGAGGGGITIGDTAAQNATYKLNVTNGAAYVSDYLVAVGGLKVGSAADPGAGNLTVDGVLAIPGFANVSASLAAATGGGGMSNFGVAGTSGATQTITDGNTLTIAAGNGISTVGSSTDTITVSVGAAQTTITSLVNSSLEIGRDADNRIKFGTDNQIIFEVAGGDNVIMKSSGEIEATSLDISGSISNDDGAAVFKRTSTGTNSVLNVRQLSTGTVAEFGTASDGERVLIEAGGNILADGNISGSSTSTGSFGALNIDGGHFTSASLASGGGGAVSAVANGADNRIATFSSADALNGETYLTFDGVNLKNLHNSATIYAAASISSSAAGTGSFGCVESVGAIRAGDDVIAFHSSDERLKNNITIIENPIDKVKQLRGIEYEWNGLQSNYPSGSKDSGIIAQDVQKVLPQLVKERKGGYLGVRHDRLVGLLIESVKEQQQQIDELKKEVQELKNGSS